MQISLDKLELLVKAGFSPKINTITGYEKITDVYRKTGEGVNIKFSDNTELKAANYHQIKINGEWVCCKDISEGDIVENKKVLSTSHVPCQDWLDFTIDADHESYIHNGMVHHNSGKSAILYCVLRFLLRNKNIKGLLLVPNVSLCHQLFSDFQDYSSYNGWDANDFIHTIYSGKDKDSDHQLYLSTWQSMQTMLKNKSANKDYFRQFDFVISDECHLNSGAVVSQVINQCVNAKIRIGVTGTLNGTKIHSLQLESLFGSITKVISTKELMEKQQVTQLAIKCLVLNYPEELKKEIKGLKYQNELEYIITNPDRNKFIKNLVLSLQGNTLLLFQMVEKHGEVLYKLISESKYAKDKNVFFIHGNVDAKERENIRHLMEKHDNVILIGSVGTVSTGTNIRNLHNIVFASPSKSSIRTKQSIGRILRLHNSKNIATLYDIADDLRYKKHTNYTMLHFYERLKIYDEEKFDYKILKIDLIK